MMRSEVSPGKLQQGPVGCATAKQAMAINPDDFVPEKVSLFYTLWDMAFGHLLDYNASQQSSLIGATPGP